MHEVHTTSSSMFAQPHNPPPSSNPERNHSRGNCDIDDEINHPQDNVVPLAAHMPWHLQEQWY